MGRTAFVADRILAAAFDLFADEGYEAVSTRMIAERAKVGPASMYRHFPSKEALGLALYARAVRPILVEAAPLFGAVPGKPATKVKAAAATLTNVIELLYTAYDQRPRALALIVFPPHEFTPPELDKDDPDSFRARLVQLCCGDADRAGILWGAILGPLTDRYLHQRAGLMAPLAAQVARVVVRLLP